MFDLQAKTEGQVAEAEQPQDAAPKKKSKKPLLIGLVLAFLLGGGGFYATWSGLILAGGRAMQKVPRNPTHCPISVSFRWNR